MYCTHWPLSSLLDTGQGHSNTLFKGHTIGYKCVSNFQHNKYLNVYSFLSYGYRNCLPGALEFYLVCSYHCFLPFFFILLLLLPLLLLLLLLSFTLIFLCCFDWYLYNFSFYLCLQFRNNWWPNYRDICLWQVQCPWSKKHVQIIVLTAKISKVNVCKVRVVCTMHQCVCWDRESIHLWGV